MKRIAKPLHRRLRLAATTAMVRVRPSVPESVWRAMVTARSMAGSGPLVAAVPPYRRALVIAAHPDDETLGCGGTAALLAASGCHVDVLVLSCGEGSVVLPGTSASETASARERQATAACTALGIEPPAFARLPDGRLSEDCQALRSALEKAMAGCDPEVVLTPWPLDAHPDHQAIPLALAGLELAEDLDLWCYEVWAPVPANRIVDISNAWDAKERALACYHGTDAFDLDAHLALQRWRSIFGLDGFGHAEAFLVLSVSELRRLISVAEL